MGRSLSFHSWRTRIRGVVAAVAATAVSFSIGIVSSTTASAAEAQFQSAAQVFRINGESAANNSKIFWQAVSGANSYSVYRVSAGSKTLVGTTSGTSIDDYGLPVGTAATYEVLAYSGSSLKGKASSNSVETFTPTQITLQHNNVTPPAMDKDPVGKTEVPVYNSRSGSTPKPFNGSQKKWVNSVSNGCPSSAAQLAKYWSIRQPSDNDQRRSWIQVRKDGTSLHLFQDTHWQFQAQADAINPNGPTVFACDTHEYINDAKSGSKWELPNSRIEGTTFIENPANGHAVLIGHLEGTSGYDRAELLIVDIDPDKGVVSAYHGRPSNHDIRDLSAYVEGGTLYVVAATDKNQNISIIKINSSWSQPESILATVFKGQGREAPKIHKIGNYYYLYTSATRGFYSSQTKYIYSTNLAGQWSNPISVGNATASDGQFYLIRTDSGSKRVTYSEIDRHYGQYRSPKTALNNVLRMHPLAINGTYHATAWYPEVDVDSVYGAVPVQNGRNISYGRVASDSENGNTNLLTDGSDSEDASSVGHSTKPYTVTLDLGVASNIREVDFSSRLTNSALTYNKYGISVSNDGKSFTQIVNGDSSNFSGFIPNSVNTTARYVRLTMRDWPLVSGSGSQWNPPKEGLYEIYVYGSLPPDTTKPVFSGVGDASIESGTKFDPRAGVTAKDDRDGDLTKSITVSGSVDTSVIGTYTLTYSVSDKAGNTATATRKVTVTAARPRFTVRFDGNGGSGAAAQSVAQGGKAAKPKNPTRSGYSFDGWYT
ncbi:immunoglobulin-like domain-containing protein, partial [Bifidobacterium sp. SO1]